MARTYRIAEARTPEELEIAVRELLRQGWTVQGGVSVVALGDDSFLYSQALVFG